ncbi:MAG: hypothetical protein RLZ98_3290 [Pseudomonadota bacterium]|jgi:uncharacterized membrane protein
MAKAAYFGLVGLAVGFAAYALLMWLANRNERQATTPEEHQVAQGIKVLATANLIMIPVMMFFFGLTS